MPSRWLSRLGVLMIVAGLVLGGYVAWQLWGTTWQSERRHAAIVEDVEAAWAKPGTAPTLSYGDGDVSAVVRIPAFGQDFAVPLLEGTSDEALAAGFGHFEDTASAGARGNFALAGHRITHGEPLRDMPMLEAGDEVVVETARATFTYVLDTAGDALEVPFTAGWVLDDVPENPDAGGVQPTRDTGQRLITLTTCSEIFHTDDRLVAFGHLVQTDPR